MLSTLSMVFLNNFFSGISFQMYHVSLLVDVSRLDNLWINCKEKLDVEHSYNQTMKFSCLPLGRRVSRKEVLLSDQPNAVSDGGVGS